MADNNRFTTTTHAVPPYHSLSCFSLLFLFSLFFAPAFHIQRQGRLKARAWPTGVSIDAGGTLTARVGGRLRQPWTSTN